MKRKLNLLLGILPALFVCSCYYDNEEDLYKNYNTDCNSDTTISYSGFIQPLLATECAVSGCHAGPAPAAGRDLTRYQDVKAIADNGSFAGRITGTTGALMPQGGPKLPQCDIEKIQAWISQGAPEN